jgi:hypothetical protein
LLISFAPYEFPLNKGEEPATTSVVAPLGGCL